MVVHLVRKKLKGKVYLYLQKTQHIAYIGPESKFTKQELDQIIERYTKEEVGKDEVRRLERQDRKRNS